MNEVRCKVCGAINRETARFCASCGQILERRVYQPAGEIPPRGRSRKITFNIKSIILGLIFIIAYCTAYPLIVISQQVLSPETIKDALAAEDFYNRFPEAFVEQMDFSKPRTIALEGLPCIEVSEFTSSDWTLVATNFLPPDWLQLTSENMVDQIFDFFDSDVSTLSLWVSLDPIRNFLADEQGYQVYHEIVKTKSSCSLFDMAAWIFTPGKGCLSVCKPPIEINKNIWDIVRALSGATPTEYDLGMMFDLAPLFGIRQIVRLIRFVRMGAYVGLIIGIGLLALSLLSFKPQPIRKRLFNIGVPISLAGLFCVLIAISIPILSALIFSSVLSGGLLAPGFQDMLMDILRSLTLSTGINIGLPSIALIVVGGLLMLPSLKDIGKR